MLVSRASAGPSALLSLLFFTCFKIYFRKKFSSGRKRNNRFAMFCLTSFHHEYPFTSTSTLFGVPNFLEFGDRSVASILKRVFLRCSYLDGVVDFQKASQFATPTSIRQMNTSFSSANLLPKPLWACVAPFLFQNALEVVATKYRKLLVSYLITFDISFWPCV